MDKGYIFSKLIRYQGCINGSKGKNGVRLGFRFFVEDSLGLIENPLPWVSRFYFGRGGSDGSPYELRGEKPSYLYYKKNGNVSLEVGDAVPAITTEDIKDILRGCLSNKVKIDQYFVQLFVEPYGSITFNAGPLLGDGLVFRTIIKEQDPINHLKVLDDLAKRYRYLRKY